MNESLVARDLVKEYRQGASRLRVLRSLSLTVSKGEFLVVAGPSGAGKSTLLHLLGLLDSPTSGRISFDGRALSSLSRHEQSRWRNQLFGFVFQFFHLLPDFTALENVIMPAMVAYGPLTWPGRKHEMRRRAEALLERIGLKDRVGHRPSQLSGGERQRVAFCRALINEPRVLLLDEPTGNLDSKTGTQIHNLISELHRTLGQTIVMVTHDERAASRADRVVHIADGQIVKT